MALLEVKDLKMHYQTQQGAVKAIDGLTLNFPSRGLWGSPVNRGVGRVA